MFKVLMSVIVLVSTSTMANEMWNGLVIEAESRCAEYDKSKQYPYAASLEYEIVEQMNGSIYGPYTGSYFESIRETDIEHIVAASEAHDSGMCKQSDQAKALFASDLLNLTLASPKVNRCSRTGKCGLDAGEWLPEKNQCWFAHRVVLVKRKYSLSVDHNEAKALQSILDGCESFEMVYHAEAVGTTKSSTFIGTTDDPLSMYDDNGNGKITCAEARAHGIAPVTKGHPAYQFMRDADDDGIVCESK